MVKKAVSRGIIRKAFGAVVGETLIEVLSPVTDMAMPKGMSREEFIAHSKAKMDAHKTDSQVSRSWALFGTQMFAILAGQDVDIAMRTATNAIDNNFFFTAFLIASAISAAYDYYKGVELILSGDPQKIKEGLWALGINIVTDAAGLRIGKVLLKGAKLTKRQIISAIEDNIDNSVIKNYVVPLIEKGAKKLTKIINTAANSKFVKDARNSHFDRF